MNLYTVDVVRYYKSNPMPLAEAEKVFSEKVKQFPYDLVCIRDTKTGYPIKSGMDGEVF